MDLISSFNKGMSGGEAWSLLGNTILAEAMVCVVGFLSYVFVEGGIFWTLAAATSVGSIVVAPFAAMTVKKVNPHKLKIAIATQP